VVRRVSHQGCTSRLHSSAALQGRTPKATRHPRPPPILALRPVGSSRPNYRQGWADASTHRPAPVSPPTDLETSSIPPQRFRPRAVLPREVFTRPVTLRAVFAVTVASAHSRAMPPHAAMQCRISPLGLDYTAAEPSITRPASTEPPRAVLPPQDRPAAVLPPQGHPAQRRPAQCPAQCLNRPAQCLNHPALAPPRA